VSEVAEDVFQKKVSQLGEIRCLIVAPLSRKDQPRRKALQEDEKRSTGAGMRPVRGAWLEVGTELYCTLLEKELGNKLLSYK
jgi:hypothetical protein